MKGCFLECWRRIRLLLHGKALAGRVWKRQTRKNTSVLDRDNGQPTVSRRDARTLCVVLIVSRLTRADWGEYDPRVKADSKRARDCTERHAYESQRGLLHLDH